MEIYEYLSLNPKFNDIFNKAMTQHTSIVMKREKSELKLNT